MIEEGERGTQLHLTGKAMLLRCSPLIQLSGNAHGQDHVSRHFARGMLADKKGPQVCLCRTSCQVCAFDVFDGTRAVDPHRYDDRLFHLFFEKRLFQPQTGSLSSRSSASIAAVAF